MSAKAPALSPKDDSVETLRGIAIILLVAFHSVYSTASGRSLLEYMNFSFEFVRMPLFTTISGFVYAIRPVQEGRSVSFLKGKGRRILLPFVSVATLAYLIAALVPGVNNPMPLGDLWRIYFFGYGYYWFLQGIAWVFLVVTILEKLRWLDRPLGWALCLLSAALLFLWLPRPHIFGLPGFLYLLPYFLLGLGLNRFSSIMRSGRVVAVAALVALASLALHQLHWWVGLGVNVEKVSLLSVVVGLSTNVILFRYRRIQPWLARLGFYSYSIYLFHFIGMALGNRAARGPLDNVAGNFFMHMLLGLSVPIVIEMVLLRSKILRRVFLGLR